jgi:hypothetical protein
LGECCGVGAVDGGSARTPAPGQRCDSHAGINACPEAGRHSIGMQSGHTLHEVELMAVRTRQIDIHTGNTLPGRRGVAACLWSGTCSENSARYAIPSRNCWREAYVSFRIDKSLLSLADKSIRLCRRAARGVRNSAQCLGLHPRGRGQLAGAQPGQRRSPPIAASTRAASASRTSTWLSGTSMRIKGPAVVARR